MNFFKNTVNFFKSIKTKPLDFVITMEILGKQFSSEEFAKKIEDLTNLGTQEIVFVIGSSCGIGKNVSDRANLKMSMSKMTFLHEFARLILVEQIYRAFKIIKNRASKKDIIYPLEIKINEKSISMNALLDTGNMLKEPITGTPVAVIEKTSLYDLLPKEILNNTESILGGDFEKIPEDIKNEYIPRLKIIPFASLGKQNGMLVGIKISEIVVKSEDEEKKTPNIIIGIYGRSLTKNGEYRALVGVDLL